MTEREACLAAAEYIRKNGWAQGAYRLGERCCIVGALGRVGYSRIYIRELWDVCDGAPERFNDRHCESADDAIAALEIAADLASWPC